MISNSLLTQAIVDAFTREVGKSQETPIGNTRQKLRSSLGRQPTEEEVSQATSQDHTPKALLVSFNIQIDHTKESGYRQVDLVLYAPYNYVDVYSRERWNVIPLEHLEDDGEGDTFVKAGKDYVNDFPPWKCLGSHDSGWRGFVDNFLEEYANKITGFEGGRPCFQVVTLASIQPLIP